MEERGLVALPMETDENIARKERQREKERVRGRGKSVAQTSECLSRRVNDYNDGWVLYAFITRARMRIYTWKGQVGRVTLYVKTDINYPRNADGEA